MNNKFKIAAAGVAASALIIGGGSFALWSQSSDVAGAEVTTGNLAVAALDTQYFDISQDRTDAVADTGINDETGLTTIKGESVTDLANWKMIPGDTLLGVYDIDGAIEGDNMVANLTFAENSGDPVVENSIIAAGKGTVEYAITDAAGEIVQDWGTLGTVNKWFASLDNSLGGDLLTLPAALDSAADYKIAVKLAFDESATDREVAQAKQDLAGLTVTLAQSRTGDVVDTGGFNG